MSTPDKHLLSRRIVRHNDIPDHDPDCNCLHCRTAWEDDQEAKYALRLLDAMDVELRQARPATDAEWQAFFDAEWPRVTVSTK